VKEALLITVSGKVQNVGFRYFVLEKANHFKITGFVNNLANRQVYIEAEGENQNLAEFLHCVSQGPTHAYVEKIDTQESKIQNFNKFERR